MALPTYLPITTIALVSLTLACIVGGCTRGDAAGSRTARIERGAYIVHQASMCVDCHSPRDARGEFIDEQHLAGAPLPFAPTVPMPAWSPAAPALAGLPAGYTDDDMIAFLTTGLRPHGGPPVAPPMPAYRLNRRDAEAVTAYLSSLARPQP